MKQTYYTACISGTGYFSIHIAVFNRAGGSSCNRTGAIDSGNIYISQFRIYYSTASSYISKETGAIVATRNCQITYGIAFTIKCT
ncbi:hypothetical protein D3C76_450140 [compost metagenome]